MPYYVERAADNRVISVTKTTETTSTEMDALIAANTGHTYQTVTDLQFAAYVADPNLALGLVLSDANVFSAYVPNTPTLRASRRRAINAALITFLDAPPTLSSKDLNEVALLHSYATKVYACSQVDANIDTEATFDILEAAAKVNSRKFGANLKVSSTRQAAWNAYLDPEGGASQASFASPDDSYEPALKSGVTVPSAWQNVFVENVLL